MRARVSFVDVGRPRLDGEHAAAGHRIARVDREVQEHLLELVGVGLHGTHGGVAFDPEIDVFADQAAQQRVDVVDHRIGIEDRRRQELLPAEREQLARQRCGAHSGLLDFLHGRRHFVVVAEQLERDLAVPHDGGEQVVEVVRNAARELADRFHLLRVPELVLELRAFRHIVGEHDGRLAAGDRHQHRADLDGDECAVLLAMRPRRRPCRAVLAGHPLDTREHAWHFLFRPDVADPHLEEFLPRVLVVIAGGAVHFHESQRAHVIHPAGIRRVLEGHAVALFGVAQLLLGVVALQLAGLQGGRHGIERVTELAKLAWTAGEMRPAREIPPGETTGDGDELFDWPEHEELATRHRGDDGQPTNAARCHRSPRTASDSPARRLPSARCPCRHIDRSARRPQRARRRTADGRRRRRSPRSCLPD